MYKDTQGEIRKLFQACGKMEELVNIDPQKWGKMSQDLKQELLTSIQATDNADWLYTVLKTLNQA